MNERSSLNMAVLPQDRVTSFFKALKRRRPIQIRLSQPYKQRLAFKTKKQVHRAMKDVFAARKVSKALELGIQLARIVLSVAEVVHTVRVNKSVLLLS